MIEFDEKMIEECFYHGNDRFMIEHISKQVGYMVEKELKQMNFKREQRQ